MSIENIPKYKEFCKFPPEGGVVFCKRVCYANLQKKGMIFMHIVLLEPEIPQNAGNIARTCAVTNSVLHLIKPLGFSVEDKYLKRAGLDYWKLLDIRYYENFEDFCEKNPNAKIWMASTKRAISIPM